MSSITLAGLLADAAGGRFPEPSGATVVVRAPHHGEVVGAVVGFTGFHVVAADVAEGWVREHITGLDRFAAAMSASFLDALGRHIGAQVGVVDVVLCAPGRRHGGERAVELVRLDDGEVNHPRVRRARALRDDVRVFADGEGRSVLTIGRGLAGRWEASYEVDPVHRRHGLARGLLAAARGLIPEGEPLFVEVAPGNAASLRAALAAEFVPIGSEVLLISPPARG